MNRRGEETTAVPSKVPTRSVPTVHHHHHHHHNDNDDGSGTSLGFLLVGFMRGKCNNNHDMACNVVVVDVVF